MHNEALNDDTRKIWEQCAFLKDKDFYLAGGTALALQLGHRKSIDLDFFSDVPIKKTLLADIEKNFNTTATVIFKTTDELTIEIKGVKITFLYYPFPLLADKVETGIISLASVRDIASMKAYALGRRQAIKDYVDLYCILSNGVVSLHEIIDDAKTKYNDAFNGRLFLEQLAYTDDLDNDVIDWLAKEVSKQEMKDYFSALIVKERSQLV